MILETAFCVKERKSSLKPKKWKNASLQDALPNGDEALFDDKLENVTICDEDHKKD